MCEKVKHEPWTCFKDLEKRPVPTWMKDPVPCPQCQGYTLCIDTENAYGEGRHFQLACSNCGGMGACGYMEREKACVHDMVETKVGNCLYKRVCSKCGATHTIDSSG